MQDGGGDLARGGGDLAAAGDASGAICVWDTAQKTTVVYRSGPALAHHSGYDTSTGWSTLRLAGQHFNWLVNVSHVNSTSL
jgi:uncharacterized protein (AIM24 family)